MKPEELHVVVVSNDASVSGGAASVAIVSAASLADAGAHVVFFAGAGPVDELLASRPALRVHCADRPTYKEQGRRGLWTGLWDRETAADLRAVLAELPRDRTVVHFHSFVERLSGSVTRVPREFGMRTAYTFHEYALACPYAGFYNFRTQSPCGVAGLSAKCWLTPCSTAPYPRKLWRNLRLLLQKKLGGAPEPGDAFLSISQFGLEAMRPYLGDDPKLFHVRNPIPVEKGERVRCEEHGPVVFVGRLSEEKAPELLAQACADAGREVVFIGDGPMKEAILRANPAATVSGWLPSSDVQFRIRQARVMCLPSKWYEGAPLVVFEALAHGIPVIVSDGCAGREFVADGETGWWFESGSVKDLTRCVSAAGDDARIAAMSALAFDRYWADPPTLQLHTETLLNVYGDLLSGEEGR